MILAAAVNPETYSTADDEIARLKRCDPEALTSFLSRYQQRLYRFLIRLVQDPALADDLFQQTWLRVMQKIGGYDARARFDTWLFSVAHNLAVDHLRRQRSRSLDEPDESGMVAADRLASSGPDPFEEFVESERAAMLAEAMQELPAIHREVLSLRFEEGMKLEQIAEVAAVPLSTVKSRLHRALDSLRGAVERRLRGRRSE
ncbi:MAG TPA: sigma-70 family RNA polymerase sigma factor [Bryobacteraceae bacterium]|nr:sigma-70 family RNA polymerase sigma factor [Bryobacteraceae bacterium]